MLKDMHRKPNRLINETSPYLLQHAYNPVEWYAWGNDAFNRAKEEDKPVLLSIGYSTCHWCHVMERESFEDSEIAGIMNNNFICIKLDREERPDIDHIYMDAVQAMTGQGGWPLNVFLTPDKKPFYGGTYFPPRPYAGRPSWKDVLLQISKTYNSRKELIIEQTEQLLEHLKKLNQTPKRDANLEIDDDYFHKAFNILKQSFDHDYGGYGTAPKFPSTYTTQFLLNYYYFYHSEEALDHALKTIRTMLRGGIYDQLRGGLCRYATDNRWLIPHFEKMLYDNANFINLLCDAYKLTGDREIYNSLEQTVNYVMSELLSDNNLFYAAYDADSEGVEGKFYCWTAEELKHLLKEDSEWYFRYYNIDENGNWEHTNILYRSNHPKEFAESIHLSEDDFLNKLNIANHKLLRVAENRIKPSLDYKQIASWNAMMLTALVNAFEVTGSDNLKKQILNTFDALVNQLLKPDNTLYHQISKSIPAHDANLEDYATVIQSSLAIYRISGISNYLSYAHILMDQVMEHFWNAESNLFQFAHHHKDDVIIHKVEIFDNVIASGNSMMLNNLVTLNRINPAYKYQDKIEQLVNSVKSIAQQYPQSFSFWLINFLQQYKHSGELIITGRNALEKTNTINKKFKPDFLVLPLIDKQITDSIFQNKFNAEAEVLYYLCINNTCTLPASDIAVLHHRLNN